MHLYHVQEVRQLKLLGTLPPLVALALAPSCRAASSPQGLPPPPPHDAGLTRSAEGAARREDAAVRWTPPPSFAPQRPDLGLPLLGSSSHRTLFDPAPCGVETERCGTYNHVPELLIHRGHVVVLWQNHQQDENGPGQRVLGVAVSESELAVSAPVVVAPSPVPFAARTRSSEPELKAGRVNGVYVWGGFRVMGGALFFFGRTLATIGWTDAAQFRKRYDGSPLPTARWRATRDERAGFDLDVWFGLGMDFVQRFDVVDGGLVATSERYFTTALREELQVTPEVRLKVGPLEKAYAERPPITRAPADMQRQLAAPRTDRGSVEPAPAPPSCEPGPDRPGHASEFGRADGARVALRDNLARLGVYYASVRGPTAPSYGCSARTNLPGWGLMSAGELPDGGAFVVGGLPDRHGLYLTRSSDGRRFECSWLLAAGAQEPFWPGLFKHQSGAQYPSSRVSERHLWIAYSVGKQRIGLTRVPLAELRADDPRACASSP